ncbi:MAG TPA: ABC transporter ATP-binding protein [Thermoanaerobaculia bacterium]|nr:ABC transporter ATP-binding protein [Thermoanaerobaculia bacterium]
MARQRQAAAAPPDPAQPVICIRDLYRIYRMGGSEVRALDGISLDVERGEFVAVMGPSGSGKSTLMNILGCLDRPTSGSYQLDGVEISNLDRDRRAEIRNDKIGFVFQNFNLLARTNALENVELPLLYSAKADLTDAVRRERARRCLERVGLAERWDHTSAQLSGGQQQRVAIARSLVNDPAILLADEPTGNLDSRTSEEVIAIFQALNDEGRTVVLITHDTDIAQFAQRIVAFRDGKIISDHAVTDRRRATAGSFADAAPAAGDGSPAAALHPAAAAAPGTEATRNGSPASAAGAAGSTLAGAGRGNP